MKLTEEEMERAVGAAGWRLSDYYHLNKVYIHPKKLSVKESYSLEEAYCHEITQNYLKGAKQ